MAAKGPFCVHAEVRGRELGKRGDYRRKKIKGPAMKAGKRKAGKIFFPLFFCHRFPVKCREVKVNVLCVVLKGEFLILHALDLTAAPSSHKDKRGNRDDGKILRRKQG